MSDVSAVSTSTATTTTTSQSTAEESYEMWISILATQLQNQDPTDPVDTTEYTNQLIGISQLEQQTLTNETLNTLLVSSQSIETDMSYSYLGEEITAFGDTTALSDGSAEWLYEMPEDADNVTLEVLDMDGNVVYTTEGETDQGIYSFQWDGTSDDGSIAEDAPYTLAITAYSEEGELLDTTQYVRGTVTNIINDGTDTYLMMDGVSVSKDTLAYVAGV
jgi:flagellar basal-body rod modification protein FlgD